MCIPLDTFECINTFHNIIILIDEVNKPKFNGWKNLEDDEIICLDAENASRWAFIPVLLRGASCVLPVLCCKT